MTRQRKWQLKVKKEGRCTICGEEKESDRFNMNRCKECQKKQTICYRNRYRRIHGIPLHLPTASEIKKKEESYV